MLLSIHRIDGGLELGHGLKGDEEEEEGEGDEENILVFPTFSQEEEEAVIR